MLPATPRMSDLGLGDLGLGDLHPQNQDKIFQRRLHPKNQEKKHPQNQEKKEKKNQRKNHPQNQEKRSLCTMSWYRSLTWRQR